MFAPTTSQRWQRGRYVSLDAAGMKWFDARKCRMYVLNGFIVLALDLCGAAEAGSSMVTAELLAVVMALMALTIHTG